MKTLVPLLFSSLVLLMISNQSEAQQRAAFNAYPQVASQIFVYNRSLYSSYTGQDVSQSSPSSERERKRLGTVQVEPKRTVYVDRLNGQMDASFELVDIKTGTSLGYLNRIDENTKLLFSGHGAVYLYNQAPSVCHGMTTRKYVLRDGKLVEMKQAILYFDKHEETETLGNVKIFPTPNSQESLAEFPKGSRLIVLGVSSDTLSALHDEPLLGDRALLVKTPLGLTGWYIPKRSVGDLSIHACN